MATINGATAGQTTTDLQPIDPFQFVTISDSGVGAQETLTISIVGSGGTTSDADGVLSGAGLTEISPGTYRLATGSPSAVSAAIQSLVFTPTQNQTSLYGSVSTTFTITDTPSSGSPVSDSTTSVSTVQVNDLPSINGARAGQTTTDESTAEPLAGVSVSDPDSGVYELVHITLLDASGNPTDANGTLSGGGITKTVTGTYSFYSSASGVASVLAQVVFTPTAHEVAPGQSVVTTLDISDVRIVQSNLAFAGRVTNDTATIVTTAVNDPPTISGTVAGQATTDRATLAPFSGVTISDPDVGVSENVTITLASGGVATDADGTLAGTDLTKTGVGTYALTAGSPANVTALLDGLVFTPTAGQVAVGSSVTTTATISVAQGSAVTSDSTTSIVATAAAGGTTTSGGGGGTTTPGGGGTITPAPTVSGGGYLPFTKLIASGSGNITVSAQVLGGLTGTYSNLGSGGVSSDGTTYTVTGTSAAVNAALSSVVFTPASGVVTNVEAVVSGTATDGLTDTSGNNDELVGSSGQNAVVAGSGDDTLFAATGASTLFAGAGSDVLAAPSGQNVLEGGTGNATMFGGAGSTTMVGATGATTMVGGAGGNVMEGGAGPAVMFDGFGAMSVVGGTGSATIVGLGGADTIGVTSSDNLIGVGPGNAILTSGGAADTIIAGGGSDQMTVNGASLLFAGSGALSLTTGAGSATLVAGAGSDTVTAGAGGGLFYSGFGANNLLTATNGNATMTGLGTGDLIQTEGSGAALLIDGAGGANETLSAETSTGNVTLIGGGADVFDLGAGSDQVRVGPGGGTINEGAGASLLFFVNGDEGSAVTINHFKVGTDLVSFQGYAASSSAYAAQVLAGATVANGSETLTLGDQTKITFVGIQGLTTSSFI
jgi:hypothetical protein